LGSFEGLPVFDGVDFDTYYTENILDKVYYLEFKSNQNWNVDCAFCTAK
jgi:ubiquitin carboxyl-terminal hydrolase 4/11/15